MPSLSASSRVLGKQRPCWSASGRARREVRQVQRTLKRTPRIAGIRRLRRRDDCNRDCDHDTRDLPHDPGPTPFAVVDGRQPRPPVRLWMVTLSGGPLMRRHAAALSDPPADREAARPELGHVDNRWWRAAEEHEARSGSLAALE